MLTKPSTCAGCSLASVGAGFMLIDGVPQLGVTLMGEALGKTEAEQGRPFVGRAGFRLEKMIQRAGYERGQFQIVNAAFCQPPGNAEPPQDAIDHCRQYWEGQVKKPETKVIVPMGNVALWALTGQTGILAKRGYVQWSEEYQAYILPTVHPSFIMQGNSNWETAWLYDLRHAVEVAQDGWEPIERGYLLDPSPGEAWDWLRGYEAALRGNPACALSADIETPDKSDAEDESDITLGYMAGQIYRIGFAYVNRAGVTQVLSVPWEMNYLDVIGCLLEIAKEVVFCYRHFDVPRILAHGVAIKGEVIDVQEAWHCLHSDLPKKLEHMVPYLCPRQPEWKYLSGEQPSYYNAIDAAVQIESWHRLKELLREAGIWELYQRDVRGLNPILISMGLAGMPIDQERRFKASEQLGVLKEANRGKLNEAAEGARPEKIYKRFREGLGEVKIEVEEKYCSACGQKRASKSHPCVKRGEGIVATRMVEAIGWAKPLDFKPSNVGLVRYAKFKGYKLITRWDKTSQRRVTSMDENAVRRYALQHTEDPVWALALEERELGKLLSTYVGRVVEGEAREVSPEEAYNEARLAAVYGKLEDGRNRTGSSFNPWAGQGKAAVVEDDDIPF